MATIELNKLVKRYGKVEAVKGIDLDIADGEFVVFVGPSGCGKSTTLRMIAGLEEISGGELKIGNEVVNEREPKQRNIAMVFPELCDLSAYDGAPEHRFGLYTSNWTRRKRTSASKRQAAFWARRLPRPASGSSVRRSAPARRHRSCHGA